MNICAKNDTNNLGKYTKEGGAGKIIRVMLDGEKEKVRKMIKNGEKGL
jgi:hypothetical protein